MINQPQWKNVEKKVDAVLKSPQSAHQLQTHLDLLKKADQSFQHKSLAYRHSLLNVLSLLSSVQNSNEISLSPNRLATVELVKSKVPAMREAVIAQYEAMITDAELTLSKNGKLKTLQNHLNKVKAEMDLDVLLKEVNEKIDENL